MIRRQTMISTKPFINIASKMLDNNQVYRIFQDIRINQKRVFTLKTKRLQLQYIQNIARLNTEIKMITYIKQFGIKRHLFIFAHLKLVRLWKQLLVLEITQGRETTIPEILLQNKLPQSMRFYDPLLGIIDSMIDENVKHQFNVQKNLNSQNIMRQSLRVMLMQKLGISEDRLSHAHVNVNEQFAPSDIDYLNSQHTKELQAGKCLVIKYQNEHIEQAVLSNFGKGIEEQQLDFKYLPQTEVQDINQQFLMLKLKKLVQTKNILQNHDHMKLQQMVFEWIDDNMEELYRNKKASVSNKTKPELQKPNALTNMALKNDEEAIEKHRLRQQLMKAASEMMMKRYRKQKTSGVYKIKENYEQSKNEFISYS